MLVYERIVKRGRTTKRKDAVSSRGSRPPQKRRRTETVVSTVRSPPVGTPLTAWPARALKRYPSWVDHLQLERIRQARVVEEAVRFAQQYYRDVVSSGGGEPLCFTLSEEFESVGASLGDVVLEEDEIGPFGVRAGMRPAPRGASWQRARPGAACRQAPHS